MTLRRLTRLLAVGGALLAAAPPQAIAAEFTLRFAALGQEQSATYQQVLKPLAEAVAKDSNDRIDLALKPATSYGKPADLFNMIERGDIEIALTVQGYNPGRFPQSSVMELPLMFDSSVSGTKAMQAMFKEGRFDKDYASVKVLGVTMLAPYGIFTTGRKLVQLKDLRGLRVRTPSPTVGLALARLGMIPIGVPSNLIGESLANGTVDALTYGWDSMRTGSNPGEKPLIEQAEIMIDANFAAPAMMFVMNKAAWAALPPDLQAILEKDFAAVPEASSRVRDASEAAARQALRANPDYTYIALTEEQHADMERIIQPVVKDWKAAMSRAGLDGDGLYDRARELVRQSSLAAR